MVDKFLDGVESAVSVADNILGASDAHAEASAVCGSIAKYGGRRLDGSPLSSVAGGLSSFVQQLNPILKHVSALKAGAMVPLGQRV